MPFALHEYDKAFSDFFSETIQTLARVSSPLLSQIKTIEVTGSVGSRVRDRQGMDVELEPRKSSTEVTADLNSVRDGAYEQLHAEIYAGAESMAEQLVGFLVDGLNKVTEATGNSVNAGGKRLDHDVMYEVLEKMEFSLDKNDELVMPTLIMHPDQAEKLRDLPPPTEAQRRKMEELKVRKKEEALARRRSRRLS